MPNYTKIPDAFRKSYEEKFTNIDKSRIAELAEEDPVIFAYYFLGKKVRLHQAFVMDRIIHAKKRNDEIGQRIAVCWARQLGKSISLGIFCIWACWYNKYPVSISKITVIYLCSKEDEAAVELLEKIKLILYDGDRHMSQYTSDQHFFTGSLKEPNNSHQTTFLNDCFMKSIPPTMKAVGKSASWFILDEAHRLRCVDMSPDDFFRLASVMVAETGGGIILSSTAEGIVGFFYDAIDPEGTNEDNTYEHFWFSHEIWDDDTPECAKYKAYVQSEKIAMTKSGQFKLWQQEFESLFTVTASSFFSHEEVDAGVKDTPQVYEWKDTPCSLGIDYGMKVSRTVLTIRTVIKGEIIQLFQYRCPADFDTNNITNPDWEHSIQNMKKRYNLQWIVADDCPQGDTTNRWIKSNANVPLTLYNFRSDQMSKTDGVNRNCAAYSYRAKLKEGILKIPKWNTIQQFEMKIIEETEQKVLISIKAPTGQLCDTFDSDMMACIPFLDMTLNSDFGVSSINLTIGNMVTKRPMGQWRNQKYYEGVKEMSDEELKQYVENITAEFGGD
ncbi:MAG: hypothetical protein ABIJ08_06750 [Nanoarchaeota archaeon]